MTVIRVVSAAILMAALSGASAFVTPAPKSNVLTRRAAPLQAAALEAPPLSPKTIWGQPISNIRQMQEEMRRKEIPEFAPEVSAKALKLDDKSPEEQLVYFKKHAMELKMMMQKHGAVVFRDFELMKSQQGFQDFYAALGMKVCLDPLHSVSARPTVDGQKNSPVYEAVNKESRKNFFIGEFQLDLVYLIWLFEVANFTNWSRKNCSEELVHV